MAQVEGGSAARFTVTAPGKLILTGEHAVVYGKLALAASVDLLTRITVTIPLEPSSFIAIQFEDYKFECSLPIARLPVPNDPAVFPSLNPDLVERLKSFLSDHVPNETAEPVRMSLLALGYLFCSIVRHATSGFQVLVKSDIPIGAGLGSSAAFSVALSAALHVIDHHMASSGSRQPFVPDLELINSWAFQCERMFHATPSGIDNAVCTYGGVVKFQTRVVGSLTVPEANILLVDTGLNRQTKKMVEGVRAKRERFPDIVDPILDSIGQISHQMILAIQQPPETSYPAIKELLSMNHWLLASLGVSCGSLDDIHSIAAAHDQAAKMTGAGGGGLAFVWLDPSCTEMKLGALRYELMPGNYKCRPARLGVRGLHIEYP